MSAFSAAIVTIGSLLAAQIAHADAEWHFAVSVDNKPVGFHTFILNEHRNEAGTQWSLHSEARFNVKLLFINAYRYAHQSDEIWQNDCVERIDARTDDNGKTNRVLGRKQNDSLVITSGQRTLSLDACVLTFAYWNPGILAASQLLNPQTGEYLPIKVNRIGSEALTVQGKQIDSDHFRLSGLSPDSESLQIDLWYSKSKQWLALDSITNGRHLRYQLQ